jgi:hypothetical protein
MNVGLYRSRMQKELAHAQWLQVSETADSQPPLVALPVCAENLDSDVVVMKSAKDRI